MTQIVWKFWYNRINFNLGEYMSYILEILPSLLDGAKVTIEIFFIVIILSIPLSVFDAD